MIKNGTEIMSALLVTSLTLCDPPHRYLLRVYVLDIDKLDVTEAAAPAMLGFAMHRHILAQVILKASNGR